MQKKILIVDDSKVWREFLKDSLENKGHIVEVANDGIEGINKAFDFLPEVIITDYVMPKMNGIQLCRFIRSYNTFKSAGVILLTASEDTLNSFWSLRSGVDLFIKKSSDNKKMLNEILNFLENNFNVEWSRELYKYRKEPFGELVDILEETLKFEIINKEILKLSNYINDDEYMMRRIFMILKELIDFENFYLMILTSSSGRIYAFSSNNSKINQKILKNKLFYLLQKPITPSEWVYKGNMFEEKILREPANLVSFPIVHESNEIGLISFENPKQKNELYDFYGSIAENLGILIYSINTFIEYKMASEIDSLTKLYNKKKILSKLSEYIHLLKREYIELSVAMFDIDDFKKINDTHGHLIGDLVLKNIGKIIKNSLRESDFAGRYGGEEFFILLPYTNVELAGNISQRILKNIESFDWEKEINKKINITISGGISSVKKGDLITTIIETADKNLYKAKRAGKNRIFIEGIEKQKSC
ncbi:diguanylate cyclase response regulator [Tepiditoga spiralis]|uniref:Diguanylate cyclase response regulator n=1 Tax=Tepiditoga spiralis TaxID=2108365 RepID=A0A7G1GA01_9BACT|nr:diguanylate cyclase [Tepiditoga spiralis]BBE31847.1 diguanylate cyclase response regulator [Tepiditoga spiralis]